MPGILVLNRGIERMGGGGGSFASNAGHCCREA